MRRGEMDREAVDRIAEEVAPEVGVVIDEEEPDIHMRAALTGARMVGTVKLQEMTVAAYGLTTAEGILTGVLEMAEKDLEAAQRSEDAARAETMVDLCRKSLAGLEVIRGKIILPVLKQVAEGDRDGKRQRARQELRKERSRRRAAEHERRKTDGGDAPEE